MIADFMLAFFGTMSFAILFQAPQKNYLFCGITGAIGWVVFLASSNICPFSVSIFISALSLTILSRQFSIIFKAPVTVFLISGIFPLVPGTAIYYTAYYLFLANYSMAVSKGLEALSTAGAISIGILFGSAIPQKLFTVFMRTGSDRG